jgi:small subunit ribosomal protein S17
VASAKAKKMIVVSREYPRPVPKYKRYERSRSKVHAYLPECIEVKEGEEVVVAECRPLSKTVSFVVVEVSTKDGGGN